MQIEPTGQFVKGQPSRRVKLPPVQQHLSGKVRLKQFHQLPSDFHALRYQSAATLRLNDDRRRSYTQTDWLFLADVHAIAEQSKNLLHILQQTKQKDILDQQECDELHQKATLHRAAGIINSNSALPYEESVEGHRCNCGCKLSAGHPIPLCSDISNLVTLGPGTLLFFTFQKGMIINLVFAVLILGIFATMANLNSGSSPSTLDGCVDSKCVFLNNSSAYNNSSSSLVETEYILGLIFCLFWVLTVRLVRLYGRRLNQELDKNLQTASDFAVKLTNLPFGQYCENDLIQYIQELWQKNCPDKPLALRSIQIIYNMDFARKMLGQIQTGCSSVVDMLTMEKNGTETIAADDYHKYKALKAGVIQNYELLNDLRKKFLNDPEFRKKIATSCCIIQFQNQQGKDAMLQKYGQLQMGLLKQLKARLLGFCCPHANNITFRGRVLDIQRAPEPSDLIWLNCQKRSSILRLVLIYLITCLIIAVSFAGLLGLYSLNYALVGQNSQGATLLAQGISIATALALQVVNKVLWVVLQFTLDLEYNPSLTEKIVSLMNKALFATCFNTLVLPMIVFAAMRGSLYGEKGLVGFIFDYHITTITAGLILRFLNPVDLLKRLVTLVKPLRHKFMRFARRGYGRTQNEQYQAYILKFYEGSHFDVTEGYIFVLTNIFHASFYCHLSPPLLFFVLAEVFLYFWINKIKLLRLFKIPQITGILVFDTALAQADLAPIIYGFGLLLVQYYQQKSHNQQALDIKYPLIAITIGMLSFFNPAGFLNSIAQYLVAKFQHQDNKVDEELSANPINNKGDPMQQAVQTNGDLKDDRISRLENYYYGSNSLKLLGYEKVLKGEDQNKLSQELQNYCQSFFRKKNKYCEQKQKDCPEPIHDSNLIKVKSQH